MTGFDKDGFVRSATYFSASLPQNCFNRILAMIIIIVGLINKDITLMAEGIFRS